jgi:plasmid stability protein
LCALAPFDINDIKWSHDVTDLLIRNLPPHMKRQIKQRARAHGRSMSEEAKLLITKGLGSPEQEFKMGTWLSSLVRPEDRGDDLIFEYRGDFPKPPDFE